MLQSKHHKAAVSQMLTSASGFSGADDLLVRTRATFAASLSKELTHCNETEPGDKS